MISTKYISIKAVLADLISIIDERYWNEASMLEWATKGLRKLKIINKFADKMVDLEVCNHRATLPSDFISLTQIAWKLSTTDNTIEITLPSTSLADKLDAITHIGWAPMRLTVNPYFSTVCDDDAIINCTDCLHEFSIDENLILTTTLKEGDIRVAYKGYLTNDQGDALMPDNEEIKEALLHYVLYKYWLQKYQMKEEGAEKRMDFHLTMWSHLAAKAAGDANMPDVNTLENIRTMRNRLVPRENRFNQLFLTLSNSENVNF